MIFNSVSHTGRPQVCCVVYVKSYWLVLVYVVFDARQTRQNHSHYNPGDHVASGTTQDPQLLEDCVTVAWTNIHHMKVKP